MMRQSIIFFLLLFVNSYSYAQEINKCGQLDLLRNNQELALRGDHWGYEPDDEPASTLRNNCVFYIVPMYS